MTKKTVEWCDIISDVVKEEDIDWIHVITGGEGIGKTSLAWFIGKTINPNFSVKDNVFSVRQLKDRIKTVRPGDPINVDEGALVFFSGDTMTNQGKKGIKLATGIRTFNAIMIICIPNFWILTRYIREHRVKTVARVTKKGFYHYYSPRKVKMIERDRNTLKTIWPDWDFRDSFPDARKLWPEEWKEYEERKKRLITEDEGSGGDVEGRWMYCTKCKYDWFCTGKTRPRCPVCGSSVAVVAKASYMDVKGEKKEKGKEKDNQEATDQQGGEHRSMA